MFLRSAYSFTTAPHIPNSAPTQTTPLITGNTKLDDITAFNQTTQDINGDEVVNIYNWQKNGVSIANINLPFDTQTDPELEYSGLATTRDYAYGAIGDVFGASWVPDGIVGGAYSFDGNDFIRFEEPGTRYDGGGNWGEVSLECWVKGTSTTSTERLIWKSMRYDQNDFAYRLDYRNRGSRIEFTWYVGTVSDGQWSTGIYSLNTDVTGWHHVVGTYKSGVGLRLYIDGVEVLSNLNPTITGNIVNTDGPFEVAFRSGSDFAGLVDEVRLYPYEISPFMVNQRYLETKDGSSSSSTTPAQDTQVGENWRCQVTPNDAITDGTTLNSATANIIDAFNAAPTASNAAISPLSPLTTDELVASYNYTDPEDHPEYDSIIQWYKNGVADVVSGLVDSSLTSKGEVWYFTVTPFDGFDYGTTVASDSVVIGNTAPTFTDVAITPDPAFSDDTLTAVASGWVDVDEDTESYNYQWQKWNGAIFADIGGQTSSTLTSANFVAGDILQVTVTAFDGTDVGNSLTAIRNIVDTNPPTEDAPTLVSSHGTDRADEDLIATPQNVDDIDGDNVTSVFTWQVDGQYFTGLQLPFETNSSLTALDYSGNGNNGAVTGATWTNQGLIGGAFSFSGSSSSHQVITVPDSASLGNDGTWNQLTLEYWVNPAFDQRGTRILNKNGGDAGDSGKYMIGFNTNGAYNTVFFGVTTGGEYLETYADSGEVNSTIPSGVWSHIVGTYESGVGLKIYINGELKSFNPDVSGSIDSSVGEDLFIGYASADAGTSNRYLKGLLDEVHIYPTAFSAAQVFQRYVDTQDGLSDSETIVAQETVAGQVWYCNVTVNDGWQNGDNLRSNPLTVQSALANSYPRIDWHIPVGMPTIYVGEGLDFKISASDPNSDSLVYEWFLDGISQATTQNWTYTPLSASLHNVSVVASDGLLLDYQNWTVSVQDLFTLTVNIVGDGNVQLAPPGGSYSDGTVVNVVAVADAGWSFAGWSGDLTSSDIAESITMDENKAITATFTQDTYTLTVDTVGEGIVTKLPNLPEYNYGDMVNLTATTTNSSWIFVGWSGDYTSNENPLQITMTANVSVTATFTDENLLTVIVVGDGSVTRNPDVPYYPAGTNVTLTAEADEGWSFAGWSGDLTGAVNPQNITMDDHKTVTATFTQNEYELTVNPLPQEIGHIELSPNQDTYHYGDNVTLTAVADPGWKFDGWGGEASGTDNPLTITIFDNTLITAMFSHEEYFLTVNADGQGSVVKDADLEHYHWSDNVTLTAIPAEGWMFSGWSGDVSGSNNPEYLFIDSNKTFTATFTEIPPPFLFFDDYESGDFEAWTGTGSEGDGTATVTSNNPYSGSYSGQYTINAGAGTRRAYSTINLDNLDELYAYAYVYIPNGMSLARYTETLRNPPK